MCSTFLAISVPLMVGNTFESRQKKIQEKRSYFSVARYVGEEIVNNILYLNQFHDINELSLKQLLADPNFKSEIDNLYAKLGIWGQSFTELINCLDDTNYRLLIASGLLLKVHDEATEEFIKESYSILINLKVKLKQASTFFNMMTNNQLKLSGEDILNQKNKTDRTIQTIVDEINLYRKSAEKSIQQINKILEPYGKKLSVATYS
jgi:Mg2+ and Co2+ transporter CorA